MVSTQKYSKAERSASSGDVCELVDGGSSGFTGS